jgi:hypothetical protein
MLVHSIQDEVNKDLEVFQQIVKKLFSKMKQQYLNWHQDYILLKIDDILS